MTTLKLDLHTLAVETFEPHPGTPAAMRMESTGNEVCVCTVRACIPTQ